MILVQSGPGWSHLGLAGGSAALDWFMMVLCSMAGMTGPLSTLVSHLAAGCSHGGGLRVPRAAGREPQCTSASHVCVFFVTCCYSIGQSKSHAQTWNLCRRGPPTGVQSGRHVQIGAAPPTVCHRAVYACLCVCVCALLLL